MLRIAVCDDELDELSRLSELLERYRLEEQVDLEYTAFQSPLELIAAMESGIHYDALLLDILMGGMSGIDAAREIRELDQAVIIVFLTSSPEFAVQSYTVDALFYQLKPVRRENLWRVMEHILRHTAHVREETLLIRTKHGLQRIVPNQLEYCESAGKAMFYHMAGGRELESTGSMADTTLMLAEYPQFIQIHRAFLVNMAYIQKLTRQSMMMDSGSSLPVPHGKYGAIKERFLSFLFEQEHMR